VDAVCCDSACDGTCEACAASLTGGEDGVCSPIAADQDPEDECAEGADFPASCLADGSCDGKRACRSFAKAGTSCGDTVCVNAQVTTSVCDGGGTCQHDSVLCAPYLCSSAACSTSCKEDADCDSSTGHCVNGKCTTEKPDGQAGAGGAAEGVAGSGGEGGSPVADAGEAAISAGTGGRAGNANDAGLGGYAANPGNGDTSSTACGCRIAGGSAGVIGDRLLPLLGLLLLGARRQQARRRTR